MVTVCPPEPALRRGQLLTGLHSLGPRSILRALATDTDDVDWRMSQKGNWINLD